ncbi:MULTISPECIES: hypothetical protein [Enterococcus]|uniref:Uncharacterized protein n=1 Tax=Enterococcus xiangfangensis TaxID=1296537 RepID=A0ABU3F747_9ENTE|nr:MULTISPECIES: hypothetical protein [Enterococcus]MDT2758491.1 hypothetical protein [Enterococcus xiangfangensis]SET34006.1 hypothetical protein SAMN04487821_11050 [Enterococcus malodoratus]
MVNYFLKHPSDFVGLIGSILTVLLSGYISNKVSKRNIASEQAKIDKQITSEIEKLRIQYEYSQKLNNSNFLYRFKLEKLADLYELVVQYARNNAQVSLEIESLLRNTKIDDITDEQKSRFKDYRTQIEDDFFNRNVMRKITINMAYFPRIKKQWVYASSLKFRIIDLYIDQILGLLEITDPVKFDKKIPDNYTIGQFLDDIHQVSYETQSILDSIENEVGRLMMEMEV